MKKLLLSTVLALGWFAAPVASAQAQTPANCGVNFNPVVGVNCANIRQATYVATINDLIPAASATDFFCLTGATSAAKNIHIRRVEISGTATTLITTPISFRRLSVPDTGTLSAKIAGPRGFSTSNPTATAVVAGYDATGGNPTSTGTSALIKTGELTLGASATEITTDRLIFSFGTSIDSYEQGLDITAGSTVQYCLNLGTASVNAGALYGYIEWTED